MSFSGARQYSEQSEQLFIRVDGYMYGMECADCISREPVPGGHHVVYGEPDCPLL